MIDLMARRSIVGIVALSFSLASAAPALCCWSKWGDACGGYPSDGHGGFCNQDFTTKCSGNAACKNGPPAPPPSPTPSGPTPPAPSLVCEIDALSDYASSFMAQAAGYTKTSKGIANINGVMNGPVPIPIKDPSYKDFSYTSDMTAQYAKSFSSLGATTAWVRFNDLGASQLLDITHIFSAWPLSDSDLQHADVAALVAVASNFDFSGLDKHVGSAIAAGSSIDFRIGDGFQTASALTKGEEVSPGRKFPAEWKFVTNYKTAKGLELYAAVAAEVANHVHQLHVEQRKSGSQRLVFDVLTETSSPSECVFWPGSADEYAALFGAVVNAVKARLGASNNIKYAGPNGAFGKQFGKILKEKRIWFQDFLKACNQMGYGSCPLDIVSFHPFVEATSDYMEMAQFAFKSVQNLTSNFSTQPGYALTAFAKHGSGMFDTNDNVAGANLMADILMTLQDLPLEFAIYYKFDGWNDQKPWSPSLALLDGVLKPTAMPFVMMSQLASTSDRRKVCKCSNGDSAIAASGGNKTLSIMLTGSDSNPATLKVNGWGCTGMTTLTVEQVQQSEDTFCTSISQRSVATEPTTSAKCWQGIINTSTVMGSVRDDKLFYQQGAKSAYKLGLKDGPYVARATLSCGHGTATMAATWI